MQALPVQVRRHSVQGKQLPGTFSLGSEVSQEAIALACTYPDGLAAVTAGSFTVWAVAGLEVCACRLSLTGWLAVTCQLWSMCSPCSQARQLITGTPWCARNTQHLPITRQPDSERAARQDQLHPAPSVQVRAWADSGHLHGCRSLDRRGWPSCLQAWLLSLPQWPAWTLPTPCLAAWR